MTRFEVYQDNAGEYRWRLTTNGNIIAVASEGYTAKRDCLRGIQIVQTEGATAPVNELATARA